MVVIIVMAGLVPAIHVDVPRMLLTIATVAISKHSGVSTFATPNRVDGRDKPGHEGLWPSLTHASGLRPA